MEQSSSFRGGTGKKQVYQEKRKMGACQKAVLKYSRHWRDYDLKTFQLVWKFNESRKQGEHVTNRGTDSLGALQFGSQAVRGTCEFAQFIMDKIGNLQ